MREVGSLVPAAWFLAALAAGPAAAQPFPAKPLKIVVPYPISGPPDIRVPSRGSRSQRLISALSGPPSISDTLARLAADAVRFDSPHPVMLERLPGAITTRGAMAVRAATDGHTWLLASNATLVINPHYFHGVRYDPLRDFVLVAPLAMMPFVLLAGAPVPAGSVKALVEWLRVRPGEINFGSSGDGSTGHLAGEVFRRVTGASMVHVSYNGGTAALNGLATRQVSLVFAALPLVLDYLPSEHFRAIATTGPRRAERLPEIPTLAESGVSGADIEGWFGLFAPAGSPPVANAWLRSRIAPAMAEPATRAELLGWGLEPVDERFEQFATRTHAEQEKWAPVLRESRLPSGQ